MPSVLYRASSLNEEENRYSRTSKFLKRRCPRATICPTMRPSHFFGTLALSVFVAASVSSSADAAKVTFSRRLPPKPVDEVKVYIPFLSRYVTVSDGWTEGKATKESMTFTKLASSSTSTIKVSLLTSSNDCDVRTLEARVEKLFADAGKEIEGSIEHVRIAGWMGGGFKWLEPAGEKLERHWCVVPPRRVRASEVSTASDDTDAVSFIEKTFLVQLAKDERKSGRR